MALCCPATTAADVDLHTQVTSHSLTVVLICLQFVWWFAVFNHASQLFEAAVTELKTAASRQLELSRL